MQNLKFAFSSIMAHKMRSLLTMIGIIIGVSSIMVTHEPEIAAYAKRQIVIRDGVISSDSAQLEKEEN